jgi:hypothetical protein
MSTAVQQLTLLFYTITTNLVPRYKSGKTIKKIFSTTKSLIFQAISLQACGTVSNGGPQKPSSNYDNHDNQTKK